MGHLLSRLKIMAHGGPNGRFKAWTLGRHRNLDLSWTDNALGNGDSDEYQIEISKYGVDSVEM